MPPSAARHPPEAVVTHKHGHCSEGPMRPDKTAGTAAGFGCTEPTWSAGAARLPLVPSACPRYFLAGAQICALLFAL